MHTLGNPDILNLPKTAFLCSRKYPSSVVLKAYDWAVKQRDSGRCVISGFHSEIEKDILRILLKGTQPVILALARGMPKRLAPELQSAVEKSRLLVVTPFSPGVTHANKETAGRRNRIMLDLADEVVIAFAAPGGMLERMVKGMSGEKPVVRLSGGSGG